MWDASDNGRSTLKYNNKPLDIKKIELKILQTSKNKKHSQDIRILDEIDLLLAGKNSL